MIRKIDNYSRIHIFEHYNICDNPFMILTTKVDVTDVVEFCKKNKMFYATLGYLITKTVNDIDSFKYRYDNGNIYFCDIVNSNYTEMFEDHNIGYFDVPFCDDYRDYRNSYTNVYDKFIKSKEYKNESVQDVIWLSCFPWNSFSGLIPPFNKKISIPQFVWDKYHLENGRYYVDLMILIHHGFADGYHISQFLNLLEENIRKFGEENLCII